MRVTLVKRGDYALLGDFGGRPWYILISPLVYLIDGRRVEIKPGLITDRATVCLYAVRAILNRIALWRVVTDEAALHDWLPSERKSDNILRAALKDEDSRHRRNRVAAFMQRWVMYLALSITFPLRSFFAKPPSADVWQEARNFCARNQTAFKPYTTHHKD